MRHRYLVHLSILVSLARSTWALDNGLGLSGPAMGWSSWNHFGNNGSHCHCPLGAEGLMQVHLLSLVFENTFVAPISYKNSLNKNVWE